MTSQQITLSFTQPRREKRTLQQLRREAGYRSAKDFAAHIGIPETTYARYERQPNGPESGIPLKSAWLIADFLDCSIDLVVGREDIDAHEQPAPVQAFYDSLSEANRQRLDDYMGYLEYREKELVAQGRR